MTRLIQKIKKIFYLEIDQLPEGGIKKLPTSLWAFIWFFVKQIKGVLITMAIIEGFFAFLLSYQIWYVGFLVEQGQYTKALVWLGVALAVIRFVTESFMESFHHITFAPYVRDFIRRQLYWYTSRHSLAFFQNDFAGRIANKLLQSAPSLQDVIRSVVGSLWYAFVFTISNVWFLFGANVWLAVTLSVWLVLYCFMLMYFVPRIQARATAHSENMSILTGQVVDSFTNFLPIKYFARTADEDRRIVCLLKKHAGSLRHMNTQLCFMSLVVNALNGVLFIVTVLIGAYLVESNQATGIAAMAIALPMVYQAASQSHWIMYEVTRIFENLGTVQEGMETLTKDHEVTDKPDAQALVTKGPASIEYKSVMFNYGLELEEGGRPVLDGFNLHIPAGQKLGLVGKSGAGKSTVMNLLVRAYDLESGEIVIDGQNIADVQQRSLREHITVVTQESYLFHRSIEENIRYGLPGASMEEVMDAAKRAYAHDFILGLEDDKGRTGYKAHVGERGGKLSGGQRQRISIARAILKQAPILVLDEATSALDSESEQAIQSALESIMSHKTVIAIAHRLSTLRQMDRIIVMESGRIIEDGTHNKLKKLKNGHYAKLWHMQSGGFLGDNEEEI